MFHFHFGEHQASKGSILGMANICDGRVEQLGCGGAAGSSDPSKDAAVEPRHSKALLSYSEAGVLTASLSG